MSIRNFALDPAAPIGRRESGARLYHQGSVFAAPAKRRFDREMIAQMLFLAEALDRNTHAAGKHGGHLKRTGLDVLRIMLKRFYNKKTGECFPSYDAIAEAATCARSTVALALRRLADVGVIEIIRRKTVARVQLAGQRSSFEFAVQDSNSYLFNLPYPSRPRHGDLALPLFNPSPESDNRTETGLISPDKRNLPGAISPATAPAIPDELQAALNRLGRAIKQDI